MNMVIVGATQGLGLVLTQVLVEKGHKVVAGTLERAVPDDLKEILDNSPNRANLRVFPADVTNEIEIKNFARLSEEFFGDKADAVCCVAGVLFKNDRDNLLQDCDISELRKTFEVNTIGPIIVGKYFYKTVKKGGKILIVTSEGTGLQSAGSWIPCYALSKTAATKTANVFNVSTSDVDFFAVHPGRMNTEMGRSTAQIEPQIAADGFYKLMTGETPITRDVWYIDYNGAPMPLL